MATLKFAVISLVLTVSVFVQAADMDRICDVKPGTCDYYRCGERTHQCGSDGYYQKFGHPYCTKFLTKTIKEVSPQGQKWMKAVGLCLQKKLAYYTKDTDPCWFIEEIAIRTHAECYVEAGGCELDVRDLVPVVNTFWTEFADSRMIWQGIDYVLSCAQRY
ncbi:MAG: hypothetical protein BroJett040_24250 [Oligoflexia bacterium]|nr:MAG: hypothetical protein BroJett040_24250 [Oligoflexia bacterium]